MEGDQIVEADCIEVERKRRLDGSSEELTVHLAELGYRESGSHVEVDTYYSRPDVDFLQTVECLRVRQRDGFSEMTYKPASTRENHSRHGVISKQETNVQFNEDQAANACALLEAIGMVPLARVEKARTSYRHGDHNDVTIVVDTVTDAGVFVETEIITHDADEAAGRLAQIEELLGLNAYPVVSQPYRDLVLEHAESYDS